MSLVSLLNIYWKLCLPWDFSKPLFQNETLEIFGHFHGLWSWIPQNNNVWCKQLQPGQTFSGNILYRSFFRSSASIKSCLKQISPQLDSVCISKETGKLSVSRMFIRKSSCIALLVNLSHNRNFLLILIFEGWILVQFWLSNGAYRYSLTPTPDSWELYTILIKDVATSLPKVLLVKKKGVICVQVDEATYFNMIFFSLNCTCITSAIPKYVYIYNQITWWHCLCYRVLLLAKGSFYEVKFLLPGHGLLEHRVPPPPHVSHPSCSERTETLPIKFDRPR